MSADTGKTGRSAVLLKSVLLALWALWLTLVFTTNLCDAAKARGLLPEPWLFASGNYALVVGTTERYGTPGWLNGLLFAGVLCWEGTAAVLFWLAWCTFRGTGQRGTSLRHLAFTVSLSLWGAFMLADEVFIANKVEGTHVSLLTAQLATLLVVELLPENDSQRPT